MLKLALPGGGAGRLEGRRPARIVRAGRGERPRVGGPTQGSLALASLDWFLPSLP